MTAMADIKQICTELASLARREHYFCDDSWYSCPKAEGGCANDAEGDECTCGADAHNAKVNELLAAALAKPEPKGPTDEELERWYSDCADETTMGSAEHYWAFEVPIDYANDLARAVLARWGK